MFIQSNLKDDQMGYFNFFKLEGPENMTGVQQGADDHCGSGHQLGHS